MRGGNEGAMAKYGVIDGVSFFQLNLDFGLGLVSDYHPIETSDYSFLLVLCIFLDGAVVELDDLEFVLPFVNVLGLGLGLGMVSRLARPHSSLKRLCVLDLAFCRVDLGHIDYDGR